MTEKKITLNQCYQLLGDIQGVGYKVPSGFSYVKPGLSFFLKNLRLQYWLDKLVSKLNKENDHYEDLKKKCDEKIFGKDALPSEKLSFLTVVETPDVPKMLWVYNTELKKPVIDSELLIKLDNGDFSLEEIESQNIIHVPNVDYLEKRVPNKKYEMFNKEVSELAETIIQIEHFPFNDSHFDFDTSYHLVQEGDKTRIVLGEDETGLKETFVFFPKIFFDLIVEPMPS